MDKAEAYLCSMSSFLTSDQTKFYAWNKDLICTLQIVYQFVD